MFNYIALYEAVCKMQDKINEIIDRVNALDPSGSSDYVKTVNGLKGDVKLTGNDIPYNQQKSVTKQISDNNKEIQTVQQDIANLDLSHVLAGSSAQIQLMQQNAFNAVTDSQWTAFYDSGFRVVGIVNNGYTELQSLYLLNTNSPHKPIPLKKDAGGSGVSSVNGDTGAVIIRRIYSLNNKSQYWLPDETNENAYLARISQSDAGTESILYIDKVSEKGKLKITFRLQNEQNWNDSEIYTSSNTPPYPVTSVNGKTGAVTIPTGSAITTKTLTLAYDDSYGGFVFPSNSGVTQNNILNIIVTGFSGSGYPANYNTSIIMRDGVPHVHIYGIYADIAPKDWGASGNTITAIVQVK